VIVGRARVDTAPVIEVAECTASGACPLSKGRLPVIHATLSGAWKRPLDRNGSGISSEVADTIFTPPTLLLRLRHVPYLASVQPRPREPGSQGTMGYPSSCVQLRWVRRHARCCRSYAKLLTCASMSVPPGSVTPPIRRSFRTSWQGRHCPSSASRIHITVIANAHRRPNTWDHTARRYRIDQVHAGQPIICAAAQSRYRRPQP
jgi:hypothetical protein